MTDDELSVRLEEVHAAIAAVSARLSTGVLGADVRVQIMDEARALTQKAVQLVHEKRLRRRRAARTD